METGEHPAVLRNSVTSPAGTTASAIYELENGKFRTVIKDAICKFYTFVMMLLKSLGNVPVDIQFLYIFYSPYIFVCTFVKKLMV